MLSVPRWPVLVNETSLARYNLGRANKSLDASGTSGLVIDNLSVTWLFAAASTQTFARITILKTQLQCLGCDGACSVDKPRGFSIGGCVIFAHFRGGAAYYEKRCSA